MSDYGHHPTEIKLTLDAIKKNNNPSPKPSPLTPLPKIEGNNRKKLFVVFQPHQYNRTLELLEDFKNCFNSADTLIIPNIYESRDSEKDKKEINSKKLISLINHNNKLD
jgi:UDP-N-acetylmuramate--alanine ligase